MASSNTPTRSKLIVRELVASDPGIRRTGFAAAMRALSDSAILAQAASGIVPDAFSVTGDEVILYEVADTHPIRSSKAQRIAILADEVDELGLLLRVVVIDYTGHVIADIPGWSYGASHTDEFAPASCMDMTPAARAVYRGAHSRTK